MTTRQRHQRRDRRTHAVDQLDNPIEPLTGARVVALHDGEFGFAADGSERRTELMGEFGGQDLLSANRGRNPIEQKVEGAAEVGNFVVGRAGSNRDSRSCSLQSSALVTIALTGSRVRPTVQAAMAAVPPRTATPRAIRPMRIAVRVAS